ncbi:hypothetical protein AGMMS49975_28780 [Clostridia bacterium]|nr:hypothetical protein AGMMS49975_28780 [Clostridia bacterium]
MRLTDRDYATLRELERWRFTLSRQLRLLCGFASQRTCDRRLKLLIENGYIDRKHVLYGVPSLYFISHKGKTLIGSSVKPDKIRVEQIVHDIAVVDSAIYFHLKHGVELMNVTTEKQLHRQDGFGTRQHRPDFIFKLEDKIHAVEVELTPKGKERMIKILRDNFMAYDYQKWLVPNGQVKIRTILRDNASACPNIEVLSMEEVTDYVKQAGAVRS